MSAVATRTGASTLALLALSSLITALDFTIVYVALPEIARDLEFSAHGLQWVVSAYAIAFGGPLLLAGRLSDFGRRRMFLAGMALFAVGSVLGGVATTPALLVGARVVQGLGAAALFPSTLALVNTTFAEGPQRARAIGVWAAAGAVGLSLGALLGGALTEVVGWRGVFYVNVPLTVLGIAGGLALLSPDRRPMPASGFDVPGALTGTAGATLLVFAIARGSELGWGSSTVVLSVLAAVALLAAFVAIEASTARPLLPLRLLRGPTLARALTIIVLYGMTLNAIPYVVTQYVQEVLGFGALEAGLAFLLPTVTITVGNLLGERLVTRLGVRAVLVGGLALGSAGAALLAPAVGASDGYAAVVPGLVAFGLGVGVVYPAMFLAASSGVARDDSGIASGLSSTALQVGTAAGLAVLVGVSTGGGDGIGFAAGLRDGLWVIAGGVLLAVPVALTLPRRRGARDRSPSS